MKYFFPFFVLCMCSSCTLDYGKTERVEDRVPEFQFAEARFSRYENNEVSLEIEAGKIEQYKDNGSAYIRQARFKSYDAEGAVDTEGTCTLLAADIRKKHYLLFDDISVHVHAQDVRIYADALKYDGKTEQLTSGITDTVSLEKKDTVVTGLGFSASGVSKTFSFLSGAGGTIFTDEDAPLDAAVPDEERLP